MDLNCDQENEYLYNKQSTCMFERNILLCKNLGPKIENQRRKYYGGGLHSSYIVDLNVLDVNSKMIKSNHDSYPTKGYDIGASQHECMVTQ